jgi:hypothetical protein
LQQRWPPPPPPRLRPRPPPESLKLCCSPRSRAAQGVNRLCQT